MLENLWQALYLLLYLFFLFLMARLVMDWVRSLSRRWRPGRGAAAALECVWSVTEPPLRALRRVIPSFRIGTVSLDLAFLALLVIVLVLMYFVVGPLVPG
ncbi:MAG: YggT family protein [Longispora sp.]|nr:YggT family protein [Longispora sp. (in: high G+C Gram-positive bacteria)]